MSLSKLQLLKTGREVLALNVHPAQSPGSQLSVFPCRGPRAMEQPSLEYHQSLWQEKGAQAGDTHQTLGPAEILQGFQFMCQSPAVFLWPAQQQSATMQCKIWPRAQLVFNYTRITMIQLYWRQISYSGGSVRFCGLAWKSDHYSKQCSYRKINEVPSWELSKFGTQSISKFILVHIKILF